MPVLIPSMDMGVEERYDAFEVPKRDRRIINVRHHQRDLNEVMWVGGDLCAVGVCGVCAVVVL